VFQPASRDEKVMPHGRNIEESEVLLLQDLIQTSIKRYKLNKRPPLKKMIVYRNGCSEGQYHNVKANEIPLIAEALKQENCGNATLTVLVGTKLHNVRLVSL